MLTVFFETHATSIDNEQQIASGQRDAELSARGRRQAAALGSRYAHEDLRAVFCSDLRRSYRTAEIAFADRGLRIVRDARLRECDYGEWTGRPTSVIDAARAGRITDPFPGGESYTQAAARTRDVLGDVRRDYDGQRVLIIGHRATFYSLEHLVKGVRLEETVSAPWRWQPGWIYVLGAT